MKQPFTDNELNLICDIQDMQKVIYGKYWDLSKFKDFDFDLLTRLKEDVKSLYQKALTSKVNRENCEVASRFAHVSLTNKDKAKTPLQVRRTGKTQTWKTRPNEFKIPVKYGLYESTYITHLNCTEWTVIS